MLTEPHVSTNSRTWPAPRQVATAGEAASATSLDARLLIGLAVGLGAVVRIFFLMGSNFPLNDGGMFFAMVRDLEHNGFALPAYTSYNSSGIPFAYPPLGFYLAAALDRVTPLGLLEWFRVLPVALSILELLAFAALSRRLLDTPLAAAGATFAFALLPSSFVWLIMGGGLTRALGATFALLAVAQVNQMYTRPARRHVALAAVFSAATIVSHLEWSWFVVYTAALLWLCFGRTRAGLLRSLVVAAGAALLSAPWWLAVAAMHGFAPFVNAFSASGDAFPMVKRLAPLILLNVTEEPLFPLVGALAWLGVVARTQKKVWFLTGWLVVLFLADPRGTAQRGSVPVSLLAGAGLADYLWPLLRRQFDGLVATRLPRGLTRRLRAYGLALVGLVLVFNGLASAVLLGHSAAQALPEAERDAMRWLATQTPADSSVLVLSTAWWGFDSAAEWLPALTGRTSVGTVQGHEWLGYSAFTRRVNRADEVQDCFSHDPACLDRLPEVVGEPFTYLYVGKAPDRMDSSGGKVSEGYRAMVIGALRRHAGYTLVYDGDGAAIYARATALASLTDAATGPRSAQ